MGNHRADRRAPNRAVSETPASGGKRKAVKHAAARQPLVRSLPSTPILLGVAALAVSAGGAVTVGNGSLGTSDEPFTYTSQASALNGSSSIGVVSAVSEREQVVSRDSQRDALEDAATEELTAAAEAQAKERNAALAQLAAQAQHQASVLKLNAWVLPLDSYRITNTFGQAASYYSSGYHTGLDFAAPSGTPIKAIANGVVTYTGYDSAYGNHVIITLDDGTELWFAHMTSYAVSEGEVVNGGETIGYVGSTGNSFGPHLHVEVRPGGGDAVDPYEAFVVHGVTP